MRRSWTSGATRPRAALVYSVSISARTDHFFNDLTEIGRYYRDYVEMMAHFDEVLPGRVHHVFYEELVNDPDAQIRRLLDYCELPFEQGCVNFS